MNHPPFEDPTVRNFLVDSVDGQSETFRRWGFPPTRVLILYNACGFRCFFCASAGTSGRKDSDRTGWSQIAEHLAQARPEEEGRLIIAGNEPVLHPDFERILVLAGERGFTNIHLMTSGTWLANSTDMERWVRAGLRSVAVPVYALTPSLHDEVVGSEAHGRLFAGLDLAKESGVDVHLHTLALKRTVSEFLPLAELAHSRWGSLLSVAPLREKEGQFDWESEAMSLVEINEWIHTLPMGAPIRLVGLPSCVGRGWPRGAAHSISVYFMTQGRSYAAPCGSCSERAGCPGVVQAFIRYHGERGIALPALWQDNAGPYGLACALLRSAWRHARSLRGARPGFQPRAACGPWRHDRGA